MLVFFLPAKEHLCILSKVMFSIVKLILYLLDDVNLSFMLRIPYSVQRGWEATEVVVTSEMTPNEQQWYCRCTLKKESCILRDPQSLFAITPTS